MFPLVTQTYPPTCKRRLGDVPRQARFGAFFFEKGLRGHACSLFRSPKSANPKQP